MIADTELTAEQREILVSVFHEARLAKEGGEGGTRPKEVTASVKANLDFHIAEIARRSQAAGASVVISTYPFIDADIAGAQEAAAASLGLPFVRCDLVMDKLLEKENWVRDKYFIGDGHCNDTGYGVMAKAIHEVVAEVIDGEE